MLSEEGHFICFSGSDVAFKKTTWDIIHPDVLTVPGIKKGGALCNIICLLERFLLQAFFGLQNENCKRYVAEMWRSCLLQMAIN